MRYRADGIFAPQCQEKRVIDILFALLALIFTAPLMITAACFIVLDDGWPVFYTQLRRGHGRIPFRIYKFRTMHNSTREIEELASPSDSRFTRCGPLLRRMFIDELPQLYNVLKGDMSMVGPRPRPIWHEAQFAHTISNYDARFRVKPGITGLAQITVEHEGTSDRHMQLSTACDLQYIATWSIKQDISILLRTGKLLLEMLVARRRQHRVVNYGAGVEMRD